MPKAERSTLDAAGLIPMPFHARCSHGWPQSVQSVQTAQGSRCVTATRSQTGWMPGAGLGRDTWGTSAEERWGVRGVGRRTSSS